MFLRGGAPSLAGRSLRPAVTLAGELAGDDVDARRRQSSATYSKSGWKATAIDAGSVQGVVVQMMVETSRPASAGLIAAGSEVSR